MKRQHMFFFCNLSASRKNVAALLSLFLVQLLSYVLIQANGDFPVNDDWAYAHSVQWWLEEGRIRLSDWIAMNLLPQTLLGAAVSSLFGFSFDALRHLTQAIALLSGAFLFFFFRALSLSAGMSLLASLFLVITPWWMVLANSYMTEFYALVFILPALTLYVSLLSQPAKFSYGKWGLATLLLVIAVLQRQTALVFPVAFGIAYWWRARRWDIKTLMIAFLPTILMLVAEVLYQYYLRTGPGVPVAQQETHNRLLPMLMQLLSGEEGYRKFFGFKLSMLLSDLALASFLWFFVCWVKQRWHSITAVITLAGLLILICLWAQWWPPYHENNVLDRLGIGPFTVYGGMRDAYGALDRSPTVFWYVLGTLACFGAAIFMIASLRALTQGMRHLRKADSVNVFLLLSLVSYFLPFLIIDFFDRYVFFVLPLFFGLLGRIMVPAAEAPTGRALASQKTAIVAICIGSIVAGAFSVSAVHDYFAWQKVRWVAIRQIEAQGGTAATIDGGFEYNGFYCFEKRHQKSLSGKSWWWVGDDQYIVTMWPVPGYRKLETFSVDRWLSVSPKEVLLLQRLVPDAS